MKALEGLTSAGGSKVSLDNFKSGRLHTLITSAFSHIDIEHIVSNMIGLYFFGYNGASGAINAIMLLDIFLNPKAILYFDFIIPVPAMLLGIFLIGKDILRIIEGNSHISGSAHLGGAVVEAIAWARLRRGRF
ncbi:hypothetical protein V6N13_046413 [Hibiscus sabdariffa]